MMFGQDVALAKARQTRSTAIDKWQHAETVVKELRAEKNSERTRSIIYEHWINIWPRKRVS